MHELSIAMSIVEMARKKPSAAAQSRCQTPCICDSGQLSGVVKEALLSSYEMACETTPLEGSRLVIEEVPVECFVPSAWIAAAGAAPSNGFAAPECGTPTPDSRARKRIGSCRRWRSTNEPRTPPGGSPQKCSETK